MEYEKEITVLVNTTYSKLHNDLTDKGFRIAEEYQVNDIYLINKNIDKALFTPSELLSQCILARDVVDIEKKLLYKYKEYDKKGDIINQGKVNCPIIDISSAVTLLKYLNFEELITINDKCIVYQNGQSEIIVQSVNDKYVFIEMEDKTWHIDRNYESIEEMIKDLESLGLDYDRSNYFVRKAEIIFNDQHVN